MSKLKKIKSGKINRHRLRKALGVKQGFGKPWSAPSITFRVEFSWVNPDGSEDNYQNHWIECRQFKGEEKEFLKAHYAQSTEEWTLGETVESKFVCVYAANFLVEQIKALGTRLEALGVKEKPHQLTSLSLENLVPSAYVLEPLMVNQAFIFPTTKKGNETIRQPIYQIKWTEDLAQSAVFNDNLAIVMKNAVWHKQASSSYPGAFQ